MLTYFLILSLVKVLSAIDYIINLSYASFFDFSSILILFEISKADLIRSSLFLYTA